MGHAESNKQEFLRLGFLPLLVGLLERYQGSEMVHSQLCGAIGNLTPSGALTCLLFCFISPFAVA